MERNNSCDIYESDGMDMRKENQRIYSWNNFEGTANEIAEMAGVKVRTVSLSASTKDYNVKGHSVEEIGVNKQIFQAYNPDTGEKNEGTIDDLAKLMHYAIGTLKAACRYKKMVGGCWIRQIGNKTEYLEANQ